MAPALALVALFVTWPYRAAWHTLDDRFFQLLVGLLETGRVSWPRYLLSPMEGHVMPFWKLIYYAQWRLFGFDATAWHITTTVVHALSAWCLFLVLRRHLKSTSAAVCGAGLWAAAAIGGWDNPLIWPASGLIALSMAWLLAALACLGAYSEAGRRRWLAALGFCLAAAILSWGTALVLSVMIPVQWWLLERSRSAGRNRWPSVVMWGGVCTVLALWQAIVVMGDLQTSEVERPVPSALQVLTRSLDQSGAALWRLGGAAASVDSAAPFWLAGTGAAFALVAVLVSGSTGRRLWVTFAAASAAHLVLVNVLRANIPAEAALYWGRYLYPAMLLWCVTGAIVFNGCLQQRRDWLTAGVYVVALVAAPLYLYAQRQLATETMDTFAKLYQGADVQWRANAELLQSLEAQASARGATLVLPDLPLRLEPVEDVYFPLSAFIALQRATPHIAARNNVDGGEVQAGLNALEAAPAALAAEWLLAARETLALQRHVGALSAWAVANERELVVPDRWVMVSGQRFRLRQFFALMPAAEVATVRVRPETPLVREAAAAWLAELAVVDEPDLNWWATLREVDEPLRPRVRPNPEPQRSQVD